MIVRNVEQQDGELLSVLAGNEDNESAEKNSQNESHNGPFLVSAVAFRTVTSFARQALFAFPVYWAVADGPRPLRHPLVAVAAAAANIAFALSLAKYAP